MAEVPIIKAENRVNEGSADRVILLVSAGAMQARIEIPVGVPLYDLEPEREVYRRSLHTLLEALSAWEAAHGEIC